MEESQLLEQLKAAKIFKSLGEQALSVILNYGKVREFPANELLLEEHEPNHHLFIILSGSVKIYLPASDERENEIELATLSVGDCIGEYSFMDTDKTSANVSTLETTHILEFDYAKLIKIIDSHPTISAIIYKNLLMALIDRLRSTNQQLNLMRKN